MGRSTMARTPLFSLTKKDFRIDYLRGSGNGGQKKQKTSSACRITHIESGATGKAQDSRHQHENRELAFLRMSKDPRFKAYILVRASKEETSASARRQELEATVNAQMADEYIIVETFIPED